MNIQYQNQTSPSSRELKFFSNYPSFINAFEHCIEQKNYNNQPKELVQNCLHMDDHVGYADAKHLVNEHFGDPYWLSTAYIQKALNWNDIKAEDSNEPHSYALYLRNCYNVVGNPPDMIELGTPSNLNLIMSKLPHKLREKWRVKACEIQGNRQQQSRFLHHIVEFIEKHSKILLDPVFGSIQNLANKSMKTTEHR